MLGNIPLDYARTFVMAGNHQDRWHWQLPDLRSEEEVAFHIVETDWYDEPSIVKTA